MAAIRDLGRRGPNVIILDPNIIFENPVDNTREMDSIDTLSHIREMANAIIAEGNEAFPPITVYQDGEKVFVSAGWCRRRAHLLAIQEGAPIAGIMCMSAPKKKPEDLALAILTSNDGLPLTAIEKSKAVKRLQSFLWTPEDIARKTGWSISTVKNLIALHDAPDSIIDMVKSGQVSPTLATEIVRDKGATEAEKVLKDAVKTAEDAGKKKATKKDLKKDAEAKVNWRVHGPKMFILLTTLYECPQTDRAKLQDTIAKVGELLSDMEDKFPDLRKVGDDF